jgi:hypothetical protein
MRSDRLGLAVGRRRIPGCPRAPSRREAGRSPLRAPSRAARRSGANSDARPARCRSGCSDSRLRTRLGLRAQGRARRGPVWRRAEAATSIPAGPCGGGCLGGAATAVDRTPTGPAPTAEIRIGRSHAARGQGTGAMRTCPVCGSPLVGKRSDALYCGPPCRAEASRLRRLQEGWPVDGYRTLGEYRARQRRTELLPEPRLPLT